LDSAGGMGRRLPIHYVPTAGRHSRILADRRVDDLPIVHTSTLPDGSQFSSKRAMRAINFIERATVHTKSVWKKKPFILEPWQRGSATKDKVTGLWHTEGIIAPIFGAVKYSDFWGQWVRQFATVWVELARKQGKSELVAAIALYMLIYDGEWSAEVIGAASDKRQAGAIFNVARDMIRLSPVLSKMVDRKELEIVDSRKRIIYRPTMSTYEVVAADAMANLGANPSAILIDEVLAQPNRDLWDYLAQGFGTRPNQMLFGITTAGPDRESFAYSEHQHSIRTAIDSNVDPTRFAYVAYVDENANHEDESLWPDANPGLGSFFDIDQLRHELKSAKEKGDLAALANFKVFRLNQWGNDAKSWLDMAVWDQSENLAGDFTTEDVTNIPGVGGLDLADTLDLVAWTLVWTTPNKTMVRPHFWLPRKTLDTKHRRYRAKFLEWESRGLITIVPGDAHNYDTITAHILKDLDEFQIPHLGYDPYQAPAIIGKIESQTDTVCIKVPQTTTRLNPGSLELTRLMGNRMLTANRNPILRWNAGNAVYKQDSDGRIKPDKMKSRAAIDGLSALVIALTVQAGVPETGPANLFVFSDDDFEDADWSE
jgi:phage terminase large subunit-like protein